MTLKSNTNKYVYSCWTNASSPGSLTISLYTSGGSLFGTTTLNYASTSAGVWNYNEIKVPTSGLTSAFTVKIQSSGNLNIDDALFYPENAEITTYAYSLPSFLRTSETNTNGVSKYYSYDAFGRLIYVLDQDKNIQKKVTYLTANSASTLTPSFNYSPSTSLYPGTNITFSGTATGICAPGTLISWNFGDGSTTTPSISGGNQTHSYAATGSYTATMTASHYIYGTMSTSKTMTITAPPPPMAVSICLSGVSNYTASNGHVTTSTCPPNPTDNTHSYFTVTGITNPPPSPNYQYQWQVIYIDGGTGSTTWSDWGNPGNLNQLSVPFAAPSYRPFQMRVVVTDLNTGMSATSNSCQVGVPSGGGV